MAGAALDVAAAIRLPSLQGMAVAIPGISLRWSTWARREEQGRLRPGGAESRRRERNPLEYRTAADHMDDGCSPENVRRLDMDPHRTFKTCSPGSEIATGGVFLSGNAETRRRADSKKLEMADLKKAAAPLATHMRRLRGVQLEDGAPYVPEPVGTEVPNDSRLRRQTRLQHRHQLAELLAAVRVRPSISQASAGKRMAASHRWRRRNQRRQKTRCCRRHREEQATERKMGGGGQSAIAVPPPPIFRSAYGLKPS